MTDTQITDDDGNVGVHPDVDLTVSDEKRERGLKYVSKSRIKTYKQCPKKFWFKYWTETRPPENHYMVRGSQVHRTFEHFHENLLAHIQENGERPSSFTPLLEDWRDYGQWIEMVGNFFGFEERRWQEVYDSLVKDYGPPRTSHETEIANARALDRWKPLGVEVEGWLGEPPDDYEYADPDHINDDGPPVGDIPWMGKADVILSTDSVPGVEGNGVVILDYKTGSVPDKQYRGSGIYLEGEFYGMLFEEFYDVDGVAGYYPDADELIVSPYPNQKRRRDVKRVALGLQKAPDPENFGTEAQPLCHYGHGKCFFYDECSTSWDKP